MDLKTPSDRILPGLSARGTDSTRIDLPPHTNHSATKDLSAAFLPKTLDSRAVQFSWAQTRSIEVPAVLELLVWGSCLVASGITVEWQMPPITPAFSELSLLRFTLRSDVGEQKFQRVLRSVERIRRRFGSRSLYPAETRREQAMLINDLCSTRPNRRQQITRWMELEFKPFETAELLGFLFRFEVFHRAEEAGITISPQWRSFPGAVFGISGQSATLGIRSIGNSAKVAEEVQRLANPQEISRILGQFAKMEIVRRGALAHLLVHELGRNIMEHAQASGGWISIRVVEPPSPTRNGKNYDGTDPICRKLHTDNAARSFLEITVADDGIGLAESLRKAFSQDHRKTLRARYPHETSTTPSPSTLVDYAFDRLSSSKRDIKALIQIDAQNQTNPLPLSSGLYWIWNLVMSSNGLLAVQSSGTLGYYDFQGSGEIETRFFVQERNITTIGTIIRIYVPTTEAQQFHRELRGIRTESRSETLPVSLHLRWVGDLARTTYSVSKKEISEEVAIYKSLRSDHDTLPNEGILLLDLCGARRHWTKRSVTPLCHFLMAMNYTATVGRSAFILWNVPFSSWALFQKAIELSGYADPRFEGLRRLGIIGLDDGTLKLVGGAPEFESLFCRLANGETVNLKSWTSDPAVLRRARRAIRENSHIFSSRRDDAQLRLSPRDIRKLVWQKHLAWLNGLIDQSVDNGGAKQMIEGSVFRLPSSGELVEIFYSFAGLMANQEFCARASWLVASSIERIERRYNCIINVVVSVSRSTYRLLSLLEENHSITDQGEPRRAFVYGATIEELGKLAVDRGLSGNAVFVTDVVSSGTLCNEMGNAMHQVRWVSTIALLDTRIEIGNDAKRESAPSLATGPVFSLARRPVSRINETENRLSIVTIDRSDVTPIFQRNTTKQAFDFWKTAEGNRSILRLGHYVGGSEHHYLYYVDVAQLLSARAVDTKVADYMSMLVEEISVRIRVHNINPNSLTILHPARETSFAWRIADALQNETGALFRTVVHRQIIAGEVRFSGILDQTHCPQDGTVIIINDGVNTSETLLALLEIAQRPKPSNIFSYCAITRLPRHKITLLSNLRQIDTTNVELCFPLHLAIPVYSSRGCPVCRYREGLFQVTKRCDRLKQYADELLPTVEVQRPSNTWVAPFVWVCADETRAARIRESLEILDHDKSSSAYIKKILTSIVNNDGRDPDVSVLVDLGFVVACEPDILKLPLFAACGRALTNAAIKTIGSCKDSALLTVFTLSLYLICRFARVSDNPALERSVTYLAKAIASRLPFTVHNIGQLLASLLAESWPELEPESQTTRKVAYEFCKALMVALQESKQGHSVKDTSQVNRSYSRILVTEAVAQLEGSFAYEGKHLLQSNRQRLFDHAVASSGQFWGHASQFVKNLIDKISQSLLPGEGTPDEPFYATFDQLINAFSELQELQQRLCLVESEIKRQHFISAGVGIIWASQQMISEISGFARGIVAIVDELPLSKGTEPVFAHVNLLMNQWSKFVTALNLGFNEVFPELISLLEKEWVRTANIGDLPGLQYQPFKPPIPFEKGVRVFAPIALISRFLHVVAQNWSTSAFNAWPLSKIVDLARVELEVTPQTVEGIEFAVVSISDNGPEIGHEKAKGTGKALIEVESIVKYFEGTLVYPSTVEKRTSVSLWLRIRDVGSK